MNKNLLRVRIHNKVNDLKMPRKLISESMNIAYLDNGPGKPAVVDLLIIDDAEITIMNKRHMRRNRPTDVLAFEDDDIDHNTGETHIGDIAVSVETARREAEARGMKWQHELVFYTLHGLLHLLGMDDASDTDREKMFRVQATVMLKAGLPEPAME